MRFRLIKFGEYTIRRMGKETYVNGKPVKSEPEELVRHLKIQPVKPAEVATFAEDQRNRDFLQVFCQEGDLRIAQQGNNGWPADEFDYRGFPYEIYKEAFHDDTACIPHGRYIAVRKEVTPR